MQLTLEWLKKYLDVKHDVSLDRIEKTLSDIGLEVEEIVDNTTKYKSFVIVHVEEAIPHPNADKLKLCKVFDGQNRLQIVCGASNARAGINVVLAPIGSVIPGNGLVIKASKIRGIESQGMLCSAEELCLGGATNYNHNYTQENEGQISDGIIELPANAGIGILFADFANLNSVVFTIGLTPNRRLDAACVMGIARDLASAGLGRFKDFLAQFAENHSVTDHKFSVNIPHLKAKTIDEMQSLDGIKVRVDEPNLCHELRLFLIQKVESRYTGPITDCSPIESHGCKEVGLHIASQLSAIGHDYQLPLVMLSNFAMFDAGRPNHMYDADKIHGSIIVRLSEKGEEFKALNGNSYTLPEGLLVVADEEEILSVAGVMGGEGSKITENTNSIIVEIANFNRDAIANSGRILNIHSDSRYRFEGGIDSGIGERFENYLVDLIKQNCGGELINKLCIDGNKPNYVEKVVFNPTLVDGMVGHPIDKQKIIQILSVLGFHVDIIADSTWHLPVPSHRLGDVCTQEDVVEEIVRMHGIGSIPSARMEISPILSHDSVIDNLRKAKKNLYAREMMEVLTWSFIDRDDYLLFNNCNNCTVFDVESGDDRDNNGKIKTDNEKITSTNIPSINNPISKDMAVMRSSIIPSHLRIAAANLNRNQKNISLFECAKIYELNDNKSNNNKAGANTRENGKKKEVGDSVDNLLNHLGGSKPSPRDDMLASSVSESRCIAGLRIGYNTKNSLHEQVRAWDFFDVKADVMGVFSAFGVSAKDEDYSIDRKAPDYYHPGKSAAIFLGKTLFAYCGEIHPAICKKYDIPGGALAFEIFIDNMPNKKKSLTPQALSRYQEVQRDIAFVIDAMIPSIELVKIALSTKLDMAVAGIIRNVEMFDVHLGIVENTSIVQSNVDDKDIGGQIKEKKSVALRLTLQADDRTLGDGEIQAALQSVIDAIIERCNAKIRDGS